MSARRSSGIELRTSSSSSSGSTASSASRASAPRFSARLSTLESWSALLRESLHTLAEVVRRPQEPVGETLHLEAEMKGAIVDVVQHALRHGEGQRRKEEQLVNRALECRVELRV